MLAMHFQLKYSDDFRNFHRNSNLNCIVIHEEEQQPLHISRFWHDLPGF